MDSDMPCRQPRRHPETWTELVDSGMDEYEVAIALLNAAKEHIEDQERELAELRQRLKELA
jgi:hypothetical protein